MTNCKLVLWYNGSQFCGSQIQPDKRTVEGTLKTSIADVFGFEPKVIMSGRTDTGVHANGQVCTVAIPDNIPLDNIKYALNAHLPCDMGVYSVEEVSSDFHARKSAHSREYKYFLATGDIPLDLRGVVATYNIDVDEQRLLDLNGIIEGEKDFKFFKNEGSPVNSTKRTVYTYSVTQRDLPSVLTEDVTRVVEFKIVASSFLYKMVRNLMGAMIEVLRNEKTIDEFLRFFEPIDSYRYVAAKPEGLCLTKVIY